MTVRVTAGLEDTADQEQQVMTMMHLDEEKKNIVNTVCKKQLCLKAAHENKSFKFLSMK